MKLYDLSGLCGIFYDAPEGDHPDERAWRHQITRRTTTKINSKIMMTDTGFRGSGLDG